KAGTDAAKEIEKQHKESLKAIEDRHNQFVGTVIGYSTTLFDGIVHGWDSFKQAAMRVLDDILVYMERTFVTKMLEQSGIVEKLWGLAFDGMKTKSKTTADAMIEQGTRVANGAQVASGVTAASWGVALATMASNAATAYIAYEFLRTALLPHHSPTAPNAPEPPSQTGSG